MEELEHNTFSELLQNILSSHMELQPLTLGAERHGSLEWTFYRDGGGLTRYVSVFLTPQRELLQDPDVPEVYDVEVTVGADNDRQFVATPIMKFRSARTHHLLHRIEREAERISNSVERLSEQDLKDSYLPILRRMSS